jgi:Fe-S-cluster-containing dehydrogenase component/formate-dependent nitrite reductase membrane component NrfD
MSAAPDTRNASALPARSTLPVRWAKVVDQTRCIGCHACSTACKSENLVPLSVNRTYVKSVDVGVFPRARRAFQVTRCNQCAHAPCVAACPTSAMFTRADGIVDFDKRACIGCKACIAACPYDAIFINPEDNAAEKCNFCAHRVDQGLEPACVVVCPTEAILVGDLNDPASRVAAMVGRDPVQVRRPEKDTLPKLFYKGAHQATLDPIAARRPDGGLFAWSQQGEREGTITSGHPAGFGSSSAAALLSYDVPHAVPWGWRVSLYTWTKGIACGAYLVPLLLVVFGVLPEQSFLWRFAAPVIAGAFLALTGFLLIWDLKRPSKFYLIFTRPQWRSWLVKGAFILAGYGVVLAAHFALAMADRSGLATLGIAGFPLAVMSAVYTAFLFAQAKARDLWQSPLLPPHFLVQSLLVGGAVLAGVSVQFDPGTTTTLLRLVAVMSLLHLLLVFGDVSLPHVTAHARLAIWEMTKGRYRAAFLLSLVLVAAGFIAPWLSTMSMALGLVAAKLALVGILAHEHAHVQAGQSVPLA